MRSENRGATTWKEYISSEKIGPNTEVEQCYHKLNYKCTCNQTFPLTVFVYLNTHSSKETSMPPKRNVSQNVRTNAMVRLSFFFWFPLLHFATYLFHSLNVKKKQELVLANKKIFI